MRQYKSQTEIYACVSFAVSNVAAGASVTSLVVTVTRTFPK
jgi:hypothetical protein